MGHVLRQGPGAVDRRLTDAQFLPQGQELHLTAARLQGNGQADGGPQRLHPQKLSPLPQL